MAGRGCDTDTARRPRLAEQQAQQPMRDQRIRETYAVDTGMGVCTRLWQPQHHPRATGPCRAWHVMSSARSGGPR